MSSSNSANISSAISSPLQELQRTNALLLKQVQTRLATLRSTRDSLQQQRASLQQLPVPITATSPTTPITRATNSSGVSVSTVDDLFYTPRVRCSILLSSKKNKRIGGGGNKRGRSGDNEEGGGGGDDVTDVVGNDFDLGALFGDDSGDESVGLVGGGSKVTTTTTAIKSTPSPTTSSTNMAPIGAKPSSPWFSSFIFSSAVLPTYSLQLDVIEACKQSNTTTIPSDNQNPGTITALCFAAVEEGSSSRTASRFGAAIVVIDTLPRMRGITLTAHVLHTLQGPQTIDGGRSDGGVEGGVPVVGGVIRPGCWGGRMNSSGSVGGADRVSIPVGDLDPFSSHIVLQYLAVKRTKLAVGAHLQLLELKKKNPPSHSLQENAILSRNGLSTAMPAEIELARIIAVERLFPSPYRGPRGQGLTPSVFPRARGASGMKALASSWASEEDELLLQEVLLQLRRTPTLSSETSIKNPPPIDWEVVSKHQSETFGEACIGANTESCWLRWDNVLRPVVSAASVQAEWFADDSCLISGVGSMDSEEGTGGFNNITSIKKSQSQQHLAEEVDIKTIMMRSSTTPNNALEVGSGELRKIDGTQRLRGVGELFLGSGDGSNKYQNSEAWPAAHDDFLWALARQSGFKLDRAFWLNMRYVAPLRDSYAPFAIFQRFQQMTNPLHCATLLGSAKSALELNTSERKMRQRRASPHATPPPAGVAALRHATLTQRTREVLSTFASHRNGDGNGKEDADADGDERCIPQLHPLHRKRSSSTRGDGRARTRGPFGGEDGGDMQSPVNSQGTDFMTSSPLSSAAGSFHIRRRASHLNGWSSNELQAITMLHESYIKSKNVFASFSPSPSSDFPSSPRVLTTTTSSYNVDDDMNDDNDDDPWFGVDLVGVHCDFTSLCYGHNPFLQQQQHVVASPSSSLQTGEVPSSASHAGVVVGPLCGQPLSHSLQFHTRDQIRGVIRSLRSALLRE